MKHFRYIALFYCLSWLSASAQSLSDVVLSISDRQRVVSQRAQVESHQWNQTSSNPLELPADSPIDWHTVGTNPTQASVDGLGIGDQIAVLNQAVYEFERLKYNFLNCNEAEFSTGATVGALQHFGDSDFDPLPRATPQNYHALLASLAQRVTSLRLIPWVAAFNQDIHTRFTHVAETIGYDENGDPYVVPPENLPPGFEWKPLAIGPDFLSVGSQEAVIVLNECEAVISANFNFYDEFEDNGLNLREAHHEIQLVYPKSVSLATTAAGGEGAQIDGMISILRRSNLYKLSVTGVHPHFETIQAGHLVVGTGRAEAITLFEAPPVPTFHGTWVPVEGPGWFGRDVFENNRILELEANGDYPTSYEVDWQVGCSFKVVFKPTFSRGVDAPGVRAKLEQAAAILAGASADGKFLLNPRPGLLLGIDLGPGLKGVGTGYISCGNPRRPRKGAHTFERFDSTYALQFAGSCADYHTVYENDRTTRPQTLPEQIWLTRFDSDPYTLYNAWDSPRLKQVVGRDLIAEVTYDGKHYGGYTVNIYRRNINSPEPIPGQAVPTEGMPLIRTWIFSCEGGAEAYPENAEKLEVAGNTGEKFVIQANHVLTNEERTNWAEYFYFLDGAADPYWSNYSYYDFWKSTEGSWGWTLKALEGTSEKYRKEIDMTSWFLDESFWFADYSSKEYVGGQLVSTFSSASTEPFSDMTPSEWQIVMGGKTISGTADLGDPLNTDPVFGYGKWPLSMTINYDDIQPNEVYAWDSKGLLASQTQGLWSVTCAATGNLYTLTQKFNGSTTATNWIKFNDGGKKVKTYAAPDGTIGSETDPAVAWSEIEYGTLTNGLPGLPHKLNREDGSGSTWAWTVNEDGTSRIEIADGSLNGNSVNHGAKSVTSYNKRGYVTKTENFIIRNGTSLKTSGSETPAADFTTWGAPLKSQAYPSEWINAITYDGGRSRISSSTDIFGNVTAISNYDTLDRPTAYSWKGHGGTATYNDGGFASSSSISIDGKTIAQSSTRDVFGRLLSGSATSGSTQTYTLTHGADNTVMNQTDSLTGASNTSKVRKTDGSLEDSTGTTQAFGGVDGTALVIDLGLFKSTTALGELAASFQITWTDAWGRVRKTATPSTTGSANDKDITNFVYSLPASAIKRVQVQHPSGKRFIEESEPFAATGSISRSGLDLNTNGSLNAGDRFVTTLTTIVDSKVQTTVTQTGNATALMVSNYDPVKGVTITTFNGGEDTITETPNYAAKSSEVEHRRNGVVVSTKTTTLNHIGQTDLTTISGTGIPAATFNPTLRDDGSVESMAITIGGATASAGFTQDGKLNAMTHPLLGALDVSHTYADGNVSLTIDGTTNVSKLDGSASSLSGAGVMARDRATTVANGNFEDKITPATGSPTTLISNAAGAKVLHQYAAGANPSSTWLAGGLINSVSLGRGGAVNYTYSNNGAKDLTSIAWPAISSAGFPSETFYPITCGFTQRDAAGNVTAMSDPSGARALSYEKNRLTETDWTNGELNDFKVVREYDPQTGRLENIILQRNGAAIHQITPAYTGASDEIASVATNNFTAAITRDATSRHVTGFTRGAVTQQWGRGTAGRITSADSNNTVSGAPTFAYTNFDTKGRRKVVNTSRGNWFYDYRGGNNGDGQLEDATNGTLNASFEYNFDGIGRRTDFQGNAANALNQFVAIEHPLTPKKLYISADPEARLWVNGTEMTPFEGGWIYQLAHPGVNGGWVPWHVKGVVEDGGEAGAFPDAVAEFGGQAFFPPQNEVFTFDADGNRESSSLWNYGWDGRNHLVRARTKTWDTAPEGWDIQFEYDAEGRRFKKEITRYKNGAIAEQKVIFFVWDGWDLLYERHEDINGNPLFDRKYVWGPDIADGAAGGAGGLLLIREKRGNTTSDYYPLYDGTGHVTAIADSTGNLVAEYWYGPFGELIEAKGEMAQLNPWRYATKYFDAETGLYYFGLRYYDPATGQWMNREPLGEDESVNLYSYCHNDPINNVDVLGLKERSLLYELFFGIDPIVIKRSLSDKEKQQRVIDLQNQVELIMIMKEIDRGEIETGYYSKELKLGVMAEMKAQFDLREQYLARLDKARSYSDGAFSLPKPPPHSTAALTLGAANTPDNARLNSDFLLPTGALGFAFKGTGGVMRLFLRAGGANARIETSILKKADDVAAKGGGDLVTVFRGTNLGSEIGIFNESGAILSDAGRGAYMSARGGGASIQEALVAARESSTAAHAQQLKVWGNINDYVQAHGSFGQEISVFGPRSMVSFTTDPAVARTFGETIFKLQVPRSSLIPQTLPGAGEVEMLMINGWHP